MKLINVIPITKIPLPLPQTLSYFSSAKNLKVGSLVSAPIGKRKSPGIVIGQKNIEDEKINIKNADFRLRPIDKVLNPNPVISKRQLTLALWMHNYYYEPLGLIIKTMLSSNIVLNPKSKIPNPKQITNPRSRATAPEQSTVPDTASSIRGRHKSQTPKLLQSDLNNSIDYFKQEIQKTLKSKRQILILAPDINTLNYLQKNIIPHFNVGFPKPHIGVVTSKTTPKQSYEIWQKTAQEELQIIIGTRKALFMPFQNLGLIVLTKEHSLNYKSWGQHPKYHARETAIKLAELHGAKIIMQSETPNIETEFKNQKSCPPEPSAPARLRLRANSLADGQADGRRAKIKMTPNKLLRNYTGQAMQNEKIRHYYKIIDMRKEIKNGNYSIFSNALLKEIKKGIENNKKIALFINRRGESTVVMCRDCGYIIKCKNCDVPLVQHSLLLICHHCDYKEVAPNLCPKCNGHRIKFFGAGTQKVKQELQKILPNITIVRLDSDSAKTEKDKKEIVKKFTSEKTILIGTQLIAGAELPKIDLIGIINIETMLNMPDFHSGEKTFQTITNLLSKLKNNGKILLQTYSPDNYALKFGIENNYAKFYEEEIKIRKLFNYPPFSQIIKLTFSHKNKQTAKDEAKRLYAKIIAGNYPQITVIGPSSAFIPRKRGQYVWNIVLKIPNHKLQTANQISDAGRQLLHLVPSNWEIEVDPESLL